METLTTQPIAVQTPAAPGDIPDARVFALQVRQALKPRTEQAHEALGAAVQALAQRALADTALVSGDVYATIEALVAAIDARLTAQVNDILHHADFQQLEATWRGLHHLVSRTETDDLLRIRVLDVSKAELQRTLRRHKGAAWDQSPVFKKVYEEEFGQLGGVPYGCLVGDYAFDHSPPDVELLGEMARIAAAAHAPFIAGVSPALLQMDSWRELANPRDLGKIFQGSEYAAWRALRASDDARYVGLALPRFLARLPWGARTQPVDGFGFEEDLHAGDGAPPYVWANAAYAMAANVTRAFKLHGWCTTIRGVESGGAVQGLPLHCLPGDDGGADAQCPTEIAISDRREAELARAGLMPLVHRKHTDTAVFIGAQSLHQPAAYDDPDASANAQLAARLPYLFASCRFAHYLKCMVRDKVGSFGSAQAMQRELTAWVMQFVDGSPEISSDEVKARRPLSHAEVVVEDVEGNPGWCNARFYLTPHYQLEGMNVSLRLVTRLPSSKAA